MTEKISSVVNKLKENVESNQKMIDYVIVKHENFKIKLLTMLIEKYNYKHKNALDNEAGFNISFHRIYNHQRRCDDYHLMENIVVDMYCKYENKSRDSNYYIISPDLLNDLSKVDDEFEFVGFTVPHGTSGIVRLYYKSK